MTDQDDFVLKPDKQQLSDQQLINPKPIASLLYLTQDIHLAENWNPPCQPETQINDGLISGKWIQGIWLLRGPDHPPPLNSLQSNEQVQEKVTQPWLMSKTPIKKLLCTFSAPLWIQNPSNLYKGIILCLILSLHSRSFPMADYIICISEGNVTILSQF